MKPLILLFDKFFPLIVNGIDLSDLILIFLSFEISTFIIGSQDADTDLGCKTQKLIKSIKQNL